LCPNKLYEIGYLDFNHNLRKNQAGGPPLPLRSNMKIQCGDDGKRENLCWLTDGDIQVDGTAIRGLNDERLDNVEIVGLVFMNSIKHSLWVTKPGSITFKDCEWKDHTRSRGPVMLDYFDSYSSDELVVTLEDCHFHVRQFCVESVRIDVIVCVTFWSHRSLIFRTTNTLGTERRRR
jgi:hypothetical protein